LIPLGWIHASNTYFPRKFEFRDFNGDLFFAMPDFYHPLYGTYLEVKDNSLNGAITIRTAVANYNNAISNRKYKNLTYPQIKFQWGHSVHKQAIVQAEIGANDFMVLFIGKIDTKNIKRIINAGLHAVSFKGLKLWLLQMRIRHALKHA
ncbi:MAG: hypothetical protein Q7U12_05070, partial [Undibacterium sp.]|nr:hypothetical protein [Undibacterium sp.]